MSNGYYTGRTPRQLSDTAHSALEDAVRKFSTQVAVAALMGVSPTVVNQLLKGSYRGDVGAMEERIRGALLQESVACPVLGEITRKVCLDEQRRPLVFTNPLRVALHRACKTCPHRKQPTPKGA